MAHCYHMGHRLQIRGKSMKKTLYPKILLGYLIFAFFGFITVATFVSSTTLEHLKREKAECYDERCEIIKEEKSTQICRKIFLFSDENGNVNEDELKYLPFYIQTINIEQSLKDKNMSEKAELLKLVREAKEILESYNKNEEKNI